MKRSLFILILLSVAVTALAQETDSLSFRMQHREQLIQSTHRVRADKDSTIQDIVRQFYMDQFRHFQDPEAPHFMFMSKDATIALGVGGQVKMKGWVDWNGTVDDNDFHPFEICVPKNPADLRNIGANPSGTEIFMTLLGNTNKGKFMVYIQGGFSGYKNLGFKLKKAYITFKDWTVGYTRTTFSDPMAEIPVIDGGGQNGKISHTTPLVRWLHGFKQKWSVALSLELPSFGMQDIDSTVTQQRAYIPDFAAFLQYAWKGDSHVRLSGMMRALPYRDLITQRNHRKLGWGVQLSSSAQITKRLTLYAIGNVGEGISSYSNDLGVEGYDLISNLDRPGEMYAPLGWSVAVGAQYYFTKNIFSALTLSEARYMPDKRVLPTDYKYGLYGAVNVFWNITSRFTVGVEYLLGKRQNFNRQHAWADRVDALCQFSF